MCHPLKVIQFPEFAITEFIETLVDQKLGFGSARDVFSLRGLDHVVKIEKPGSFQNVAEWDLWQQSVNTELSAWLAPCISLSSNGRVLVQVRTHPLTPGCPLPDEVPAALNDIKYQNFGWFNDRLVCHDYGIHSATIFGARSKKMRKADWWDDKTLNTVKLASKRA